MMDDPKKNELMEVLKLAMKLVGGELKEKYRPEPKMEDAPEEASEGMEMGDEDVDMLEGLVGGDVGEDAKPVAAKVEIETAKPVEGGEEDEAGNEELEALKSLIR